MRRPPMLPLLLTSSDPVCGWRASFNISFDNLHGHRGSSHFPSRICVVPAVSALELLSRRHRRGRVLQRGHGGDVALGERVHG